MTIRLPDLPDDILFLVVANLECARDLRALALSCRRLQRLASSDGWRIFVRTRFPSLAIPAPATGSHTWRQLAESMTWQSRCWDKRSLQFQLMLPRREVNGHGRQYGGGMGGFMSVVDAQFDPATQQELVVWGSGEDIYARCRQRRGRGKASRTSWHRLRGNDFGLRGGYDDVNTVKLVKRPSGRVVVAGRHNGELALLSAEPDRFGERIAQFGPIAEQNNSVQQLSEPDTINSLDILHRSSGPLLAAAAKSTLRIYGLPEDDADVISPLTTYDLTESVLAASSARLGGARWLGNGDTIAMALVGCKHPLRYLARTPTGWSHHAAAKNERVEREFGVSPARTVTPSSLEAVHYLHSGARRETNLLLSAWKDGTIRLQDLRTPSPFDAVYQDNVDPWSNAESLMAYGTERFVAGGSDGLTIHVFDFRWPRAYHHTSGLPCLGRSPFPRPHQPFMMPPKAELGGGARCNHVVGMRCRWHELSRDLYFRPNAKFFLNNSLRRYTSSSVWSLARASDISPNFYIGVTGGVIEATLEQTPDTYPPNTATVDPNFGFDDWRAGAPGAVGYTARPLWPSLMETGDGYSYEGNDRSILLPPLNRHHGPAEWMAFRGKLAKHHRLDNGYQEQDDFR
ncbi:hypothetical protein MYCTH_51812 [Thermothelomyces thermophilus ATCC 42464]|uniref:F-box domain-containing protein n=1 Tax=Thermothelomyces thermophilus (strain ATCC 42464 / BCRC 31852 / DSM 1799) TaxID=573729 RepID=G2QF08_THET4|nr:uncharacterized protein MYCTH_51812 [Thermothelomyces thermophilus ATCC 42464]AEO59037.1 hypothetical protein MYCTH_51812 [Thermothelomyces thermophilus ATCC 42464]